MDKIQQGAAQTKNPAFVDLIFKSADELICRENNAVQVELIY